MKLSLAEALRAILICALLCIGNSFLLSLQTPSSNAKALGHRAQDRRSRLFISGERGPNRRRSFCRTGWNNEVAMSSSQSEGSGPLSSLLGTVKLACDEMSPMVKAFYEAVNSETSKLKADQSVFTIADGIVQHLLADHLFAGDKFRAIVGEEDAVVNIVERPYTVENLTVPEEFCDMIDGVRTKVSALSANVDPAAFKDKTIFIDPIDGTREFSTGMGEQCTILVGVADEAGRSVAGIIYRPTPSPPQFALGCATEGCRMHNLAGPTGDADIPKLATTNGGISGWTTELLAAGMERYKNGGCGNKAMLLIEGKASAYIQDRGVSRWDSCGPEAVLDAFGGLLTKLAAVVEDTDAFAAQPANPAWRYTYLKSDQNRDFVPGKATLTPYNAAAGTKVEKGSKEPAAAAAQVKPYANLLGLFAIASASPAAITKYTELIKAATAKTQPSYD